MGIEMFRKFLDSAEAGENVGVLVKHVHWKEVRRGFVLAAPKSIKVIYKFEAHGYILTKEEGGRHTPFVSKFKPQFFFRTSCITGSIFLKEVEMAMPGDVLDFDVELVEKAALNEGLRFTIREGTLTVGAGVITKLLN